MACIWFIGYTGSSPGAESTLYRNRKKRRIPTEDQREGTLDLKHRKKKRFIPTVYNFSIIIRLYPTFSY